MNEISVEYFRKQGKRIVCEVCPRECKLAEGQVGFCKGREVRDGVLIATNYGQAASVAIDPIEKKPLYHVFPGSNILSLGPNSCNLNCDFCQNWQISQDTVPTRYISVEDLARIAGTNDSIGVAYTYSEPLMWYEYLKDSAKVLKAQGKLVVAVTNGYLSEKPFRDLLPLIDAMNIDLKSMDHDFYKQVCGGKVEDVLRNIQIAHEEGCHIELTHLVVTGHNDREDRIDHLAKWIAALDPDIPLHISRYFPHHNYRLPATSTSFLQKAYEVAHKYLNFVYVGNINIPGTSDTVCPDCGTVNVRRDGYRIKIVKMKDGNCGNCGRSLDMLVKLDTKSRNSA
jgi:pyruvate formate lyase activating enzyme